MSISLYYLVVRVIRVIRGFFFSVTLWLVYFKTRVLSLRSRLGGWILVAVARQSGDALADVFLHAQIALIRERAVLLLELCRGQALWQAARRDGVIIDAEGFLDIGQSLRLGEQVASEGNAGEVGGQIGEAEAAAAAGVELFLEDAGALGGLRTRRRRQGCGYGEMLRQVMAAMQSRLAEHGQPLLAGIVGLNLTPKPAGHQVRP